MALIIFVIRVLVFVSLNVLFDIDIKASDSQVEAVLFKVLKQKERRLGGC